MTRTPPIRRIAQVSLLVAGWTSLLTGCALGVRHRPRASLTGLVALVLMGTWALDAFVPSLNRRSLRRGAPARAGEPPRVALTFDDGPSPDTPGILAVLASEHVVATFFMLGRHVLSYPRIARAVAEGGHAIGNHTYSHAVLAWHRPRRVVEEIESTRDAFERAGVRAVPIFRAPRGFQGALVRRVLRHRGLALIGWTRGAWDSERRPAVTIARAAARDPRDGDILLLHDGAGTPGEQRRDRTAEAIPLIVHAYRARGFRFVTVAELLEGKGG